MTAVHAPLSSSVKPTSTASPDTPDMRGAARDVVLRAIRRPFSVDDYHQMGEVGVLGEGERTELLNGEVVTKMPISSRHAGCVLWLLEALASRLYGRALVSVQNPIRLTQHSEPEPDIAILRPRDDSYRRSHPEPADVLLVVEVADTSLAVDRSVKAPLYAAADIPELWIVDLAGDGVEVYRSPGESGYGMMDRVGRGGELQLAAFGDVVLSVDAVLGEGEVR